MDIIEVISSVFKECPWLFPVCVGLFFLCTFLGMLIYDSNSKVSK